MGTVKIVLNEPFGQFLVEDDRIRVRIALLDEFFLERSVEPLTDGIVLRGLHPTPPVIQLQVLDGLVEVKVKLDTPRSTRQLSLGATTLSVER
jgi:hypothetical protein